MDLTSTLNVGEIAYETAKAIEKAEQRGFTIVRPTPKQLLIDLDSPYDPLAFDARLARLRQTNPELHPVVSDAWDSKSGGRHVVVTCALALTPPERLLLELTLGSDLIRGMHGFRKWREGAEESTSMLFRPPDAKAHSDRILANDEVPF